MAESAIRVIRDSKHTGTVTRTQVDRVIRQIETERSTHKEHNGGKSGSSKLGELHRKH